MKKGTLNIKGKGIRKVLSEALSPTFLLILLGATLLWYTSKLSHEYTTDMPLGIRIDGQKYRITATIKGRGSDLVAQRLLLKSRLTFTLDEFAFRRSTETPGALILTPASIRNAINGKINDLEITEVMDAPEFTPAPVEKEAKTKADKSGDADSEENSETPKERRQRERAERREAKEAARAAEKAAKETEEAEEGSK